jgi:MYXO-CTERM domain-containing protein
MKRSTLLLLPALAAAAITLPASPARATGMQGHIYMAMCAAEQVTDPRLRAIFDAYPTQLANGAFIVDSGYTMEDHDQGEIPHWEGFIEAYVQLIREKYPAPYDSPEASQQIATLMGMAAHGITDSTFDSLLYARAEQVEPYDMDSFDTAMDVFLVVDMPRYYIPEYAYDAAVISDVFTRVEHPIPADDIKQAVSTAHTGIAAVSNLLYKGAADYAVKYPWGRAHFLDTRTPGGYAFGAKVVMGYYRELLRRLDGDTGAGEIVIGTYPSADYPLVTLDATRPDGKVVLFFGEGLDRASITEGTVTVLGPDGAAVPAKVDVFRGDTWANVLVVQAEQSWEKGATYQVVLSNSVMTLNGASPADDITFSFTTCAAPDESGDCPAVEGPAPASACPLTEAMYKDRPEKGEGGSSGSSGSGGGGSGGGGSGGGGAGGPRPKDNDGCSSDCGVAMNSGGAASPLAALALAAALVRRRRRA